MVRAAQELVPVGAAGPVNRMMEPCFDYLLVPCANSGSRALEMMLALHPELVVPQRLKIDQLAVNPQDPGLLAGFRAMSSDIPGTTTVAVMHGVPKEPTIVAGICRLVRPDRFLQVVREPLSAFRSQHAHRVYADINGYCWSGAGFPSLDNHEIARDPPPGSATQEHGVILREPPSFEISLERAARDALVGYYLQGQVIARHFDKWSVMDEKEFAPATGQAGMSALFSFLGVRADYQHPGFSVTHSGLINRFMFMNFSALRVYGHRLRAGLCYRGDTLIAQDWQGAYPSWIWDGSVEFFEPVYTRPSPALRSLGFPDRELALAVRMDDWLALPRKARINLMADGMLDRFFSETFLPYWADNYRRNLELAKPFLLNNLTSSQQAAVYATAAADLRRFFERHPSLAEAWPQAAAAVR